jgi:hypothetical protein
MFVEYIYMNSTTPKRHAETLRNWNITFQLKKQNTYRNGIDNLAFNKSHRTMIQFSSLSSLGYAYGWKHFILTFLTPLQTC